MKNSFPEWVIDHARPGNVIAKSHGGCVPRVLFAIHTLSHQHKLHLAVLSQHQPGRLEEISNALFRDYPTHLGNNRPLRGNRISFPEFSRQQRVRFDAREIYAVIDHLKTAARQ